MASNGFYVSRRKQNEVKSQIVVKYFDAWSKIVLPPATKRGQAIGYVDLFAGPGRFEDDNESTPLWIMNRAVSRPDLRQHLITVFNDQDAEYVRKLRVEISEVSGIDLLNHPPKVTCSAVGQDFAKLYAGLHDVPTLSFIDPFGYKGLTLDLLSKSFQGWGCECIFFFNYNRINGAVVNPAVDRCMQDLFGTERLAALRSRLNGKTSAAREKDIMEGIKQALTDVGGQYVLPFRFESPDQARTSHYVIFVTKHPRGRNIMADIMAKVSSGSGPFRPLQLARERPSQQLSLFNTSNDDAMLAELKEGLLRIFAGRTMTVGAICDSVSSEPPIVSSTIVAALIELEAERKVTVDAPADERPRHHGRVTLGKDRKVTFPPR